MPNTEGLSGDFPELQALLAKQALERQEATRMKRSGQILRHLVALLVVCILKSTSEDKKAWRRLKDSRPGSLFRRLLVWQDPNASDLVLCRQFDTLGIPVPDLWPRRLRKWESAYKHSKFKPRVQVLISKDRAAKPKNFPQ